MTVTPPLAGVINVAVVGANGRMGSLAAATIDASPTLRLVATVGRGDSLGKCQESDVLVDFSTPESAIRTAEWGITNGIHVLIGTTGLPESELSSLEERLSLSSSTSAIMAIPNFSVAALLTRKFAALAVKHFESCEIIEFAHPRKAEAPSGTALETAREVGEAMNAAGIRNPAETDSPNSGGPRGRAVNGIQVHSVRLEGMMNHQTVLLGGPTDVMTLRYDTYDRSTYMSGMQLAIRRIVSRQGFYRGLESVIEI